MKYWSKSYYQMEANKLNITEYKRMLLNNEINLLASYVVDVDTVTSIPINFLADVKILNTKFFGNKVSFVSEEHFKNNFIVFSNCFFENGFDLLHFNCNTLTFKDVKSNGDCSINMGKTTHVYLDNVSSNSYFDLEYIMSGFVTVNKGPQYLNIFESEFGNLIIRNSEFQLLDINWSKVKKETIIENSLIYNEFIIRENSEIFNLTIKKVKTEYAKMAFDKVSFKGRVDVKTTEEVPLTSILISQCNFENYVDLSACRLFELHIQDSYFKDIFSIQNTFVEKFFLDRTAFERIAYFDDFTIKNYNECSKNSLRNVKLQLQKTENKIDANRYRSYELQVYKKDLLKQIKKINERKEKKYFDILRSDFRQLKRDLFVLRLNDLSSSFGTDWFKAVKFTLFYSFFAYVIFYFSMYYFDYILINLENFLIGYFRFLLITDFNNPLSNDKNFIHNVVPWIPFIIGKIIIAFGIYEVVQSFRKFRF